MRRRTLGWGFSIVPVNAIDDKWVVLLSENPQPMDSAAIKSLGESLVVTAELLGKEFVKPMFTIDDIRRGFKLKLFGENRTVTVVAGIWCTLSDDLSCTLHRNSEVDLLEVLLELARTGDAHRA